MTQNARFVSIPQMSPVQRTSELRCLFVGDRAGVQRAGAILPADLSFGHCQIYDLARQLGEVEPPDLVLSFAITPLFDCLDLAQLLRLNGFQGRQRIIDANLPAPQMICREVKLACPGLDFGVLAPSDLRLT